MPLKPKELPGVNAHSGLPNAVGLPVAIIGTAGFIAAGSSAGALPAHSLGFVYLPALAGIALVSMVTARWGARLTHALPTALLRRLFAALLAALATKIAWELG